MRALEIIAERKIEEAISRGEFDNLPCAGRPLHDDIDPLLPPEARMAWRILRNAEIQPAELARETRRRERRTALKALYEGLGSSAAP
jgi:hypothetical protein